MEQSLFHMSLPPLEFVIRAIAIYLAVLVLIRLTGKRELGQMSATEFVVVLLISNAVQNSMNGGDNSLMGGLILAVVLVTLSWGITYLNFHNPRLARIFEGSPRTLIHKGQPILRNLRRELISVAELKTLLREQGVHRVCDVKLAVLESSGSLSVERYSDKKTRGAGSSPKRKVEHDPPKQSH